MTHLFIIMVPIDVQLLCSNTNFTLSEKASIIQNKNRKPLVKIPQTATSIQQLQPELHRSKGCKSFSGFPPRLTSPPELTVSMLASCNQKQKKASPAETSCWKKNTNSGNASSSYKNQNDTQKGKPTKENPNRRRRRGGGPHFEEQSDWSHVDVVGAAGTRSKNDANIKITAAEMSSFRKENNF